MNKLRKLVRYVPFIILLINGISFITARFGIYFYDYWFIGEISSHSLLTSLYMLFFAYIHRHCLYTLVCIIALILLNVLNFAHYFLSLEYYSVYAGIVIFSGLSFALIAWKKALS